MLKRITKSLLILVMLALLIAGCGKDKDDEKEVEVKAPQPSITINVDEVSTYDYTKHFTITEGGKNVVVSGEYLDLSNIKNEIGTYMITCTYKTKLASLMVIVAAPGTISIMTTKDSIDLTSIDVLNHNYIQYFVITDNLVNVHVTVDHLDLSKLRTSQGTYVVTCSYKGVTKTISVNVTEVTYQLKLSNREISVKQSNVENYDFSQLFTAVVNGKIIPITSEMVKSNVTSEVGTYQYTVSLGETSMTLTVHVVSDHDVEIINSYNIFEIEEGKLESFDYTQLFAVYVDNEAREVTNDMIDKSDLNTPNSDNLYEIELTYREGQAIGRGTCLIKVISDSEITVNTKNLITYPNSEHIDLTSLFEIKKGSETIPVTLDMISGTVNSASTGTNIITLTYNGQEYYSTVEVKQGVIINYAKTNIVTIAKGTDKTSYNFAGDFIVLINGIRFTEVASYINTDNVDFNTAGVYEATISIPYKDTSVGITETTNFTSNITYNVVEVTYDVKILNDLVELPAGSKEYDAFDNLTLKVNGRNQKLVKVPTQASVLATYAVVTSDPIDFSYIGVQEVVVDIYVYGVDKAPITINFNVIVKSSVEISVNNTLIFEGETIYTKDIFTITLDGEEIEVTQNMIEGKVDTFTPGVYSVKINYEGITKEAEVIVLNKDIIGTYKTRLTTIPEESSTDEEGYEQSGTSARELKNLYISEDGRISIDGTLATVLYGIDENTLYIKLSSYEFTLYHNDGIVLIDPNNNLKLGYVDVKRPYIYFNEAKWEILDKVTINSASNHVLTGSFACYTLDAFNLKNLETNETIWYGLMIDLYEKIGSDTNYLVTSGEVKFASDWTRTEGAYSSLEYNNKTYEFYMTSSNEAKIGSADAGSYKYAGKTFTGTYNNQQATLSVDFYEGYLLRVGEEIILNVSGASVRNQKYGGVNYNTDEVLIISEGGNGNQPYSYKFKLDLNTLTFTYVEKDLYYGRYDSTNVMIFFDGYGTGLINFNTAHYELTKLSYSLQGNEIKVVFVDTKPTFTHGSYATLYIDALNNTLTAKYFADEVLRGVKFINNYLTDGAIINISTYTLKPYTNKVLGRKALFDSIEIIVPTGPVTDNNIKIQMFDLTDINFAVPGFYHFSITCSVGGNDVVMHYTLQIK